MPSNSRKPLGYKAYGSIAHLPGSRLGAGDHHISPGQAKIATERKRDQHDLIIVQEKLDGANCAVAKLNGEILALGRAGYLAETSEFTVHHVFARYVRANQRRFELLLKEGERVCGEFLAQAVGTKYNLTHEPFVPFDVMTGNYRMPYEKIRTRLSELDFTLPALINIGEPLPVQSALEAIRMSGHGALDEVEGAVWRVERKGEVDFLCKYVRHDKEDGKYFSARTGVDEVWNVDIDQWE